MSNSINSIENEFYLSGMPMVCYSKQNLQILNCNKDSNGIKFPKAILVCTENKITYMTFVLKQEYISSIGKWFNKDVWFSNLWAQGITSNCDKTIEEYLGTNIVNKKVFCDTQFAQMHFLPTNTIPYLVCDSNEDSTQFIIDNSKKGCFKEINFTDEKIIADLYCNAWKYSFDLEKDCFVRLTDDNAKFNSLYRYMLRDCIRYGGTAYDRLADFSRLIIYLLSKLDIVDDREEKELIDKLAKNIDKKTIIKLLKKELFLSNFIKSVKDNPTDYILNKQDIKLDVSNAKFDWE